MVLMELIILNKCVPDFLYCVCGLTSLSFMAVIWFLICGLVQVLFASFIVSF